MQPSVRRRPVTYPVKTQDTMLVGGIPGGFGSSHHAQIHKAHHRKRHAMAQIMAGTEDIVPAARGTKPSDALSLQPPQPAGASNVAPPPPSGVPSSKFTAPNALPKWITNDRQVLRFFGYFIVPGTDAPETVRRVTLHYFLADASIEVCEPREVNSGLDQGLFLRRTVLKRDDKAPYTPQDLEIGGTISIKGRTCHLVDCDATTREYYDQLNQPQPAAQSYPDTPQPSHWNEIERIKKTTYREQAKSKASKVQQFMQFSNSVLRFYCIWDDPHPLYPESRPFVIHYYLADDTIEVRKASKRSQGSSKALLSRRRLPLEPVSSSTCRYISPLDLRCGDSITIFGREFQLLDCDEFTRNFYLEHHGITQETIHPTNETIRKAPPPLAEPTDSMLKPLLEKSERKASIQKPLGADQCLRFRAIFANPPDDIQAKRSFVLSFFLLDATMAIYEPPVANSGLPGGKFLDRQNYKLHQPLNRFARATDFFVGATIQLALSPTQPFLLVQADDQTLSYCEDHADEFPRSNIDVVLARIVAQLKEQSSALRHVFRSQTAVGDNPRTLAKDKFEDVVRNRLHLRLQQQEMLTLVRKFASSGVVWYDEFCDAVSRAQAMQKPPATNSLDALRQKPVNLRHAMMRADANMTGTASRQLVEKLFAVYKINLPEQVVDHFMLENGDVDYHRFFDAIYPIDSADQEPNEQIDPEPVDREERPRPPIVPKQGPLYIPTYRSNLDTARFGVLDKENMASSSLARSQPFSNDHPTTIATHSSTPSSPRQPPTPSSAPDASNRSEAAASFKAEQVDVNAPNPLSTRFQTMNQRMNQLTLHPTSSRKNNPQETTPLKAKTSVTLTKEQRAALYKTTSQSMTKAYAHTAATTSQRAQEVIARARAKLEQETRRNPLVPMVITDVETVDPTARTLLATKFDGQKYQLRKAMRDHDRDKCGFLGEDAFMDALTSISQVDMTDDERYLLAAAFFPTAHAQVNYKQLLDWTFSGGSSTTTAGY
ncbi:hypothetical protein Ae201684P_009659 [Aphanomyces euteiches]|nr:hypothetical protein Ae201684P_009659 [Aphanomyces euteiches]